jgi:glycosyltransferase involved in cell wall biosynthesis
MVVVGIPAFNEEKNIAKVIVEAMKYADRVIVCDDGSSDATGEIARSLGAEVAVHRRNLGYGASIATLFQMMREGEGDVLVTIDGDGQHHPADILKVVRPVMEGEAEISIGSRFLQKGDAQAPGYRQLGIRTITTLTNASSQTKLTDSQSGFRAYSRRAVDAMVPSEMGMGASTELISKATEAGLRITEVPVDISYGEDSSTHNPAYHGLDVVLSTVKHLSIRHPLLFYGVPGSLSLLVSLGFWWWTLAVFVQQHKVITNVALATVASTVVGLILMAVGVMLWVLVSVVREGSARTS